MYGQRNKLGDRLRCTAHEARADAGKIIIAPDPGAFLKPGSCLYFEITAALSTIKPAVIAQERRGACANRKL
jgi:hypothetical protein